MFCFLFSFYTLEGHLLHSSKKLTPRIHS